MKYRVLIADDHAFVAWGLANALVSVPEIEIIGSVTNGIDAIVQIRKERPDCAILDYSMPGANGMEVFLEAQRWSTQTRFILLSGVMQAQTIQSFVEAGVHGIALKDSTEAEIVEVVRQVLSGKQAIGASAQSLLKSLGEVVVLTKRELAVLQAIARGHTNASAAESLNVSASTIDTHRTNLIRKFAVNSTASLLMSAVRTGLLDPACIR